MTINVNTIAPAVAGVQTPEAAPAVLAAATAAPAVVTDAVASGAQARAAQIVNAASTGAITIQTPASDMGKVIARRHPGGARSTKTSIRVAQTGVR